MYSRLIICLFAFTLISKNSNSQGCCSGGNGSPLAGGTSQGVLQEGQVELSINYQYSNSNRLYTGDHLNYESVNQINNLNSKYVYSRVAYGLSKKLTLSVEAGYFLDKTLIRLHPENTGNTMTSSGISDLVIFPRYDIYDKSDANHHTEITLGIGLKIPLGKYNDSTLVFDDPSIPLKVYTTSPPTVQPTNGSHDFIFYGFVFREYKKMKFRVFANAVYVKKGWNALGEKFGDYSSIGLFASKTIMRKVGITLQLKGEWVDPMEAAKGVDVVASYNVNPLSTGSKKISFVPQISYSFKSLSFYAMTDLPLYQRMKGTQIGAQTQITTGISYRFMPNKLFCKVPESEQ